MIRVFTSRRCLAHRAPGGYPERSERLRAILEHLGTGEGFGGSVVEDVEADLPWVEAVHAVHDERYVRRLRAAVERGDGLFDSPDNPLSPGTWDAAVAAVEVTLTATRWAAGAAGRHAFAAVRPPGHHAERDRAMGFCYFNNVAIAAQHLRAALGAERVAILDFDVHHGNGTQHLFEARPDVLYASLHQAPFYPGTGDRSECGIGPGAGAVVNVPLPADTGEEEFLRAVDDHVLPAIRAFDPDFVAVSAGFDIWRLDPLGAFRLTEAGFRELGRRVADLASGHTRGRTLTVLEGGYDVSALGRLVESYLVGLGGGPATDRERADRAGAPAASDPY